VGKIWKKNFLGKRLVKTKSFTGSIKFWAGKVMSMAWQLVGAFESDGSRDGLVDILGLTEG